MVNNYGNSKNKTQDLEAEVIRLRQEICSLKNELQDLRLNNEKFSKAFYDNRTAMSIIRLEDATFVDINDTCLEALGYRRDEMVGKSAWELNIWIDFAEREEIMNQFSKKGYVRNFECTFGKKDGDIVTALITSSVLEINGVKHILTCALDITKHKRAAEALRKSSFEQDEFLKIYFSE